ncbi:MULTISPECIES: hypothetical protein [unclassified Bacteroides]|nr:MULTISPECIES: hypothetical protein [unclassified Bacteroides]
MKTNIRSIENKGTVLCLQTPIVYGQSTVCRTTGVTNQQEDETKQINT